MSHVLAWLSAKEVLRITTLSKKFYSMTIPIYFNMNPGGQILGF